VPAETRHFLETALKYAPGLNQPRLVRDTAQLLGKCRRLVDDVMAEITKEKLIERQGDFISWRGS
jgi:hypothetical protein